MSYSTCLYRQQPLGKQGEAINWNKSGGVEGLIVEAITKPIIIFITEWLWCFEGGNEKERKKIEEKDIKEGLQQKFICFCGWLLNL